MYVYAHFTPLLRLDSKSQLEDASCHSVTQILMNTRNVVAAEGSQLAKELLKIK